MAVMFMSESEKKSEFYKKSFPLLFILVCSFIQQMIEIFIEFSYVQVHAT